MKALTAVTQLQERRVQGWRHRVASSQHSLLTREVSFCFVSVNEGLESWVCPGQAGWLIGPLLSWSRPWVGHRVAVLLTRERGFLWSGDCPWAGTRDLGVCLSHNEMLYSNGPSRFLSLSQRCSSSGSRWAGSSDRATSLWGRRTVAMLCGNPFGSSRTCPWGTLALHWPIPISTNPLSLPWPLPCLLPYAHLLPLSSLKLIMVPLAPQWLLTPQPAIEGLPGSACLHFCPPPFSSTWPSASLDTCRAWSSHPHRSWSVCIRHPTGPLTSPSSSDVTSCGRPSQSPQAPVPILPSCSLGLAMSPLALLH